VEKAISAAIKCADVLVADIEDERTQRRQWDTYSAAEVLMHALSSLVAHDMSLLPLEAIADLRTALASELDGVRAEMLILTELLRARVGDKPAAEDLYKEALNIVRTKVEPIVRETDLISADRIKNRWMKFATGTARVFAFCTGAVLLKPELGLKAAEDAISTAAGIGELKLDARPLRYAPRFALQASSRLANRGFV
jgi:hypothetical protein